MVEIADRRGRETATAVWKRGQVALECLERATNCTRCHAWKPVEARGWAAATSTYFRGVHVLCPTCRRRRTPALSKRDQEQAAARWRRLDEAERELAAVWPRRR